MPFIDDLVVTVTEPAVTDDPGEFPAQYAADKAKIKSSFPYISDEVTSSDVELNYVTGVTSSIQTQFNAKHGGIIVTEVTATDAAWTPNANTIGIEIIAIGGGGGGGGVDGQGSGTSAISCGGAGGAACIKYSSTVDATYNITIGAGGAGGASGNNDGSDGGNTTVVSATMNLTAKGGDGGSGDLGTNGNSWGSSVLGEVATGGDINMKGTPGVAGSTVSGEAASHSVSGSCPIIGGGIPANNGVNGADATAYGEGGGGTRVTNITTNRAGGDGYQGVVIIREFIK